MILMLMISSLIAHSQATWVVTDYGNANNVYACPLVKLALKEWKAGSRKVLRYLREFSEHDSLQVNVRVEGPARVKLNNMYLDDGPPPIPVAKVTSTREKFDPSGILTVKKSDTLSIQFNLLGICPYVSESRPTREEVHKAVQNIVELQPGL